MVRYTRPKGSSANALWSSAPWATLGWAACIKNARAPAVINHCSSCKRQDIESGPSKPGSGSRYGLSDVGCTFGGDEISLSMHDQCRDVKLLEPGKQIVLA